MDNNENKKSENEQEVKTPKEMSKSKKLITLVAIVAVVAYLAVAHTSVFTAFAAIVSMIVIHEWGHFIAGRICKTPIHEFSVGMGPLLLQHQGKKETKYSLRLLPLGGYCAFDADDATGDMDSSLYALSIPKRLFIYIMGPFMNIITAVLVFFSIAMFIGFPTAHTSVAAVSKDTPAYEVLQAGDDLLAIDGKELNDDPDLLTEYLAENPDQPKEITIKRDGSEMVVTLTPEYREDVGKYIIGITETATYEKTSFITAIKYSGTQTWASVENVYLSLKGLIVGQYKVSDMSGIVGIVAFMGDYATLQTIAQFLSVAGLISVNLGIMNLLPIPGLDGSKVVFSIYEAITKKRFPEKAEYYMTLVGMGLLFLLFFVVTFSDISKLF